MHQSSGFSGIWTFTLRTGTKHKNEKILQNLNQDSYLCPVLSMFRPNFSTSTTDQKS